ncbi:hypothetical protein F4824DRAFT_512433 [Ustulina deusta]|nr:hypothetical protein F4823DRAFT_625468 [Ustulina deusta]KAI3334152.1 hypothetical protein F4824DRAFT_512433 [Ustulina deusta]
MISRFPSIQSFYSREVASEGGGSSANPVKSGDGFTAAEVEAAVNPLSRPFRPSRHYDVCPIAELQTGMHNYEITGRLVNFSSPLGSHGAQASAEGYYFLVISDGTAAIAYQPLLGQRITVWATAISAGNQAEIGHIPFCSIATTIYLGRNGATHIEFHVDEAGSAEDNSLHCPLELNCKRNDHLPGLMTLKSFLSGGYELGTGKVLVCVRSVGPRRSVASKKREASLSLIEVGIYDDTAHCVLKLWQEKIPSAKAWVPNQTVLLVSQPSCSLNDGANRHAEIGIGYSSMVDINPDYPEARWLRKKIQEMAKRESVIIPYPGDNWDLQLAMHGPNRTLYTLAELEDQVRNQDPVTNFTGKLSVLVLEMNLMDHWRKATTYCTECCGIPLYANKTTAVCKNCDSQQDLSLNPRLLGAFLDESGTISGNKLIWNNDAWTQFLFGAAIEIDPEDHRQGNAIERSWRDIAGFNTNALRDLEAQLLYSRTTLTFGWSVELGRLCILGVEW